MKTIKTILMILCASFIAVNCNERDELLKFLEEPKVYGVGISNFSRTVLNTAKARANATSQGQCAKYVADAIDSAGVRIEREASAYQYGQNLINVGYTPISCASTSAGDIYVIESTSKHVYGHIEIKGDDGKFYSDFKQNSSCPYSDGCGSPRCYTHD